MRIGLDIDDTICNTHFILMKYAIKYNAEHGNKPLLKYDTNDFSKVFGWDENQVNDFFRTYYLEALKEIEPKFGVKETLEKLRKEGHEIVFITIRNDKECAGDGEARRITEEWLKKYEIPYDELHTAVFDKQTCCKNSHIDVFIDDSEKNCIAVSQTGIKTFCAINCFNQTFQNEKIGRIYSINDLYTAILELQYSHTKDSNYDER